MPYTIKTDNFEGPYAVLLLMIENEKLSITDISLSHVAEQFFKYISSHEQLPADELADFLVVASKLLYIKSRAVIPQLGQNEIEEDGLALESQLRMYKIFADISKQIGERAANNKTLLFGKIKGPEIKKGFYPPLKLRIEDIAQMIGKILEKLEPLLSLPKVRVARVVSIREKINHIKSIIKKYSKITFDELLSGDGKTDVIVSFLAILEMVKNKTVVAEQNVLFENINIKKAA